MKTFIDHEFPSLTRIDSDSGRLYETPNGDRYPSVTSVTGKMSQKSIEAWKKRVGEAEANRVSSRASQRGTQIHSYCESFLLNEDLHIDIFDLEMWNSMRPFVDKIDNIHALEKMMYSDKLKLAGTVDCIGEYEGELSVIDFKTSARLKDENKIENYFIQATAYSIMFEELFNIKIPNIVILIGVDSEQPQIFKRKRKDFIEKLVKLRFD